MNHVELVRVRRVAAPLMPGDADSSAADAVPELAMGAYLIAPEEVPT